MRKQNSEKPHLIFFRERPADYLEKPPLASSLQHLETAFLLISMRRYPHALISCASAIESALKAAFNIPDDDQIKFGPLLDKGMSNLPQQTTFTKGQLKDFRDKRNKIIHYGFSTKDDAISAELMLKTGLPLLDQFYFYFFNFSLCTMGGSYGGLFPKFSDQLQITKAVYQRARQIKGLEYTYCFNAFAHTIRWGIQHWNLSTWQNEMLVEADETFADIKYTTRKKFCSELDCDDEELLDCPVCDEYGAFVSKYDIKGLEETGKASILNGICSNCNFTIDNNTPFLADELFKNIISDEFTAKMMKAYGMT